MAQIVPARDSAELDREIAADYAFGKDRDEIAKRLGLAASSVGARLGKMFKSGEVAPRQGNAKTMAEKARQGEYTFANTEHTILEYLSRNSASKHLTNYRLARDLLLPIEDITGALHSLCDQNLVNETADEGTGERTWSLNRGSVCHGSFVLDQRPRDKDGRSVKSISGFPCREAGCNFVSATQHGLSIHFSRKHLFPRKSDHGQSSKSVTPPTTVTENHQNLQVDEVPRIEIDVSVDGTLTPTERKIVLAIRTADKRASTDWICDMVDSQRQHVARSLNSLSYKGIIKRVYSNDPESPHPTYSLAPGIVLKGIEWGSDQDEKDEPKEPELVETFKCDVCGQSFLSVNGMNIHRTKVHGHAPRASAKSRTAEVRIDDTNEGYTNGNIPEVTPTEAFVGHKPDAVLHGAPQDQPAINQTINRGSPEPARNPAGVSQKREGQIKLDITDGTSIHVPDTPEMVDIVIRFLQGRLAQKGGV